MHHVKLIGGDFLMKFLFRIIRECTVPKRERLSAEMDGQVPSARIPSVHLDAIPPRDTVNSQVSITARNL